MSDSVQAAYADAAAIFEKRMAEADNPFARGWAKDSRDAILARAAEVAAAPAMGGDVRNGINVLSVDEKWSIRFDAASNDRPLRWLRHGEDHSAFDENNAVVALYYALTAAKERAERAEARAERLREAYADAVSALDYVRLHYGELHGVGFDRVRDAYDAIAADTPTKEAGHE